MNELFQFLDDEVQKTRQEAESSLADTQENLRQSSYDVLVDRVNAAKKAGADVSDIEAQMPALLEKVTRQEAESSLADTQENLRKYSYDVLVNRVNAAKEAGADVSDIEAQMPALLEKVTRQEAESKLADTQENLRQSSYDVLVDRVNAAKEAGADVSDIEAQMPELRKKVTRRDVESILNDIERNHSCVVWNDLVKSVNDAKAAGVNVADIEVQMPELRKKVTRRDAESSLADTQENLRKYSYDVLVIRINAAKKAGVDVSDIEAQMPALLEKIEN